MDKKHNDDDDDEDQNVTEDKETKPSNRVRKTGWDTVKMSSLAHDNEAGKAGGA